MFLAGLFSDSETEFLYPGDFSQEEFIAMFKSHVSRAKIPSPFISAFGTPLAPIHRGIRNSQGATLSMVDTSKLQTYVFSAKQLVKQTNFQWRGKYRGLNEFLIWGKVPSSAIVCNVKIRDLQKIANEHPDVGEILQLDEFRQHEYCGGKMKAALRRGPGKFNLASGFATGKLLNLVNVPQGYTENVAIFIARSWLFKRGSREDFVGGVRQGYAQLSPSPISISPEQLTSSLTESIEVSDSSEEEEELSDIDSPCPSPQMTPSKSSTISARPSPERPNFQRTVRLFDPRTRAWSIVSEADTRFFGQREPELSRHQSELSIRPKRSQTSENTIILIDEDDGNGEGDEEIEDNRDSHEDESDYNTVGNNLRRPRETLPGDQFGSDRERVRRILFGQHGF